MSSLDEWFRAHMPPPEPGHLVPPGYAGQVLIPQKLATYIQVPDELLMDAGVIPDTRERKPVPRRLRLRWWLTQQRFNAAELAYRLIAGEDVPEAGWE